MIKFTFKKICIWLVGLYALALLSTIIQTICKFEIPVYVSSIVGCLWILGVMLENKKDE
jgi:hypothetical protein